MSPEVPSVWGSRCRWFQPAPLLLLLLLVSSAIPVAGQIPDPEENDVYAAQLSATPGAIDVAYLGSNTIDLEVRDISQTSVSPVTLQGQIHFTTEVVGNPQGWVAETSPSQVRTNPGDVHQVTIRVETASNVEEPRVEVRVTARYDAPNGEDTTTNISVRAVALPHPVVLMQMEELPERFSPDQQQRVALEVTNFDYYPEMIRFEASGPEGWSVSAPSSIHLGPGESTTVYVDVKAPQTPWFRLNPSSEIVLVTARTSTAEGGQYTVIVPASIGGSFLPGWVVPHVFLLVLGAAVVGRRVWTKRREHRFKKGKPEFPGLPPEKEARLAALKYTDPDRAEELNERLKRQHGKRKEAWKEDYKERKREERAQRQEAMRSHAAVLKERDKQEKDRDKQEKERQQLLEKRRKLQRQREKAQREQEADKERAADAEAKRRRLQELQRERRALQEDSDDPEAA